MPLPKNNPRRIPRAMEQEAEPLGNATWSEFNLDPINAVIAIASNINTWAHQSSLTDRWLRETSLNVGDLQNFPVAVNTSLYGLGLRWFPNGGLTRDTIGDIYYMNGYRLDLLTQQILTDIGQTQHTFPPNTRVWVYASGTYLDRVEQTGGQGTPFPLALPESVDLYFDDVGSGNPPTPPAGFVVVGGVDTDGTDITDYYKPDEIPAPYTWGIGIVAQVEWLFTKNVVIQGTTEFQDSIVGTLFNVEAESQFQNNVTFFDSVVFNVDTTFLGPSTHLAPVTIISGPNALTVTSSDNGSDAINATGENIGITAATLSTNGGMGLYAETAPGAFSNSYAVRGSAFGNAHGGRFDSDDGHGITIMTSNANKASLNIGTQATKPSSPEVGDLSVRPTGEYDIYDGTDHRQVWATPSGMLAARKAINFKSCPPGVDTIVVSSSITMDAGSSLLVYAHIEIELAMGTENSVRIERDGVVEHSSSVVNNTAVTTREHWSFVDYIEGPINSHIRLVVAGNAMANTSTYFPAIGVLGTVKSADIITI